MSEPYLGEIKLVGFNFAMRSYAKCEGQLLPISSNTALFSLLGTIYGGDGRTTFGLPDLRGRCAIGEGTGPGLTFRSMGEKSGAETVALTEAQIPSHNHLVNANNLDGDKPGPGNKLLAAAPPGGAGNETIYSTAGASVTMNPAMISNAGGGQPHYNMQPFLALNYQIALQGLYPSRN